MYIYMYYTITFINNINLNLLTGINMFCWLMLTYELLEWHDN